MNNLAQTLDAQGELADARKLKEQALEAMVRLLGAKHSDTLTAMTNLSQMLYALEVQGSGCWEINARRSSFKLYRATASIELSNGRIIP
jgi:Tetratricopeptide repeat